VVVLLWVEYWGLDVMVMSFIFGVFGVVDMLFFYLVGYVMDCLGCCWVVVLSIVLFGLGYLLLLFIMGVLGIFGVVLLFGLVNGVGSGIVMMLGVDVLLVVGCSQFLGVWWLCVDIGVVGGLVVVLFVMVVVLFVMGVWVMGFFGLFGVVVMYCWVGVVDLVCCSCCFG